MHEKSCRDFFSVTLQGFTLIEMLIVIAVIGILTSFALSSLVPARDKAKDIRIIQELNQVRAHAETVSDGDYDELQALPGLVINNESLTLLSSDIKSLGGELYIKKIGKPARRYMIFSPLNEKSLNASGESVVRYYCVDSEGRAGVVSKDPQSQITCPLE